MELQRRTFIKGSLLTAAGMRFGDLGISNVRAAQPAVVLPEGSAPAPVPLPHFPDRLHAFVWRNWGVVPPDRLGDVLGTTAENVLALGQAMGLPEPSEVSEDQWRRSYITVIRRNWHLLPYEQLLKLLGWSAEHMAYMLREDDFLFIKLGSLKPKCEPLQFAPPDEATKVKARAIAAILKEEFPAGLKAPEEPLFAFVQELSRMPKGRPVAAKQPGNDAPRFCYSYFALYGDPLLDPKSDSYPDGYLARLAALGVNGVWLHSVLGKLARFPWSDGEEAEREKRLVNLGALVKRAARHGIGIYLYLNEPRAMPLAFFEKHPELKGVTEGGYATLCTSHQEVQRALQEAVAEVCRAVPDLAGFFTISGSENLTHCWSHGGGAQCPRCRERGAPAVIAEVNELVLKGIRQGRSQARVLAWDWGWHDGWVKEIIERLPKEVALMSVSEWSIPIERGGVKSVVGEYSISTVGPGPRAQRHWGWAREEGHDTLAKIQAGNTWELSAVPYIPALENVARHAAQLRGAKVDGLMLGWTLGGYPSPNLEVACAISSGEVGGTEDSVEELIGLALERVAVRRFGEAAAPAVVAAWRRCSEAFREFPFHIGLVYTAPMQFGPSNLLWAKPTGYRATMIGFPYDDLDGWRQVYPPEIFIGQFEKMADGFEGAVHELERRTKAGENEKERELRREMGVMRAAAIHFRSTANQARFVVLRRELEGAEGEKRNGLAEQIREVLRSEIGLAKELLELQQRDARIGFEATNHYYYTGQDLLEKVINCRELLEGWG